MNRASLPVFFVLILTVLWSGSSALARGMVDNPTRHVLVTLPNPAQPGLGPAGSTWKGWSWSGGYRVSANVLHEAAQLAREYELEIVESWPITLLNMLCVVYEIPPGASRGQLLARLSSDRRIELAQPLQEFATASGEDPYAGLQHGHTTLNLAPIHQISSGRGVRVAIVDTGAQKSHPEFSARVFATDDLVERAGDRFDDDVHGTAIAGIIAARSRNALGIAGVAPDARLALLKACWPVTEGAPDARCNSFTLARAVARAAELRVDVINLSVSGPPDPLLNALVRRVLRQGIIVVGSARPDSEMASFPADVEGVIAVRDHVLRSLGAELPAPGSDVVTSVPDDGYEYFTGHSFATAHVSGVAALMQQIKPGVTPARIRRLMFDAVRAIGPASASLDACIAASGLGPQLACQR